jgi:hypothetical protein
VNKNIPPLLLLFEVKSHYITQADLEFPFSMRLPTSASCVVHTTGLAFFILTNQDEAVSKILILI